MRFIIDIESTNLLQNSLDYLNMPYRLVPEFKVHCVVIRHVDSTAVKTLVGSEITKDNLKHALRKCTEIIGHNLVGFDLPVLQLYDVLEYHIGYPGEPSELFGKPVVITDTLLWSKLLNADRFGGHSLDAWGKRLGNHKGDFNDWSKFSQEMLEYCIQDTAVNRNIFFSLLEEQGDNDWNRAYSMEVKLADLTLKQELFGFDFNTEAAKNSLVELDGYMSRIALTVDPLLPNKRMPKTESNKFIPPKIKFKKDGSISSNLSKFLANTGSTLGADNRTILYEGETFDLFKDEPIKCWTKADIEDIDTVKGYLLSLGWVPSEVKERDITKKTDKTIKNQKEILEAVERYIEQTLNSVFKQLRLDLLECSEVGLRRHLMTLVDKSKPGVNSWGKTQAQKPIWLPTTPKLTVGVEKEICPNLIELGSKAAFVKDVVEYYTYRHRRNSIAGGAVDEDGEPMTGFLSYVREDGRIPTPADTLGANTGRYRHKIVCNIPRVTSLYGEQMRNLFGCGKGFYQLGFDFASLEARIMGHFVIPYKDGKELAAALIAEKPDDLHSVNSRKLGIDRSAAKSFSYAAIYGAQPKKLAKMLGISEAEGKRLFNEYWEAVPALKELKEKIEKDWEASGKKYIKGLDGRLLGTRSKHSLINVLFQSGGAISAKWTTVRLAQMLEQRGILGNPLVDAEGSVKAYLVIAMHDEQQLAVHPELLKIKTFSSDAEAKAAIIQGCSAVGHGSKGSYIGYETAPVECIRESIASACKELELNVELGFEWIPGLTWGQCH
jgi:DNA polymerase family A